jgi:hypothetical protein
MDLPPTLRIVNSWLPTGRVATAPLPSVSLSTQARDGSWVVWACDCVNRRQAFCDRRLFASARFGSHDLSLEMLPSPRPLPLETIVYSHSKPRQPFPGRCSAVAPKRTAGSPLSRSPATPGGEEGKGPARYILNVFFEGHREKGPGWNTHTHAAMAPLWSVPTGTGAQLRRVIIISIIEKHRQPR